MQLKGTNQEVGRSFNRRAVLEIIRLLGPISRADIAGRVGLTVQTVTTITHELRRQGLLHSMVEAPKGRGHPPSNFSIDPQGGFTVGLSISPGGVEIALVDLAGGISERQQWSISLRDPEATLSACAAFVDAVCARYHKTRVLGAGIAIPGPVDVEAMSFIGSTTLEGWRGVAIAERLGAATRLPTFLDTDLGAAAYGDLLYGAGRTLSDYYYLYFGAGLGGRMVHDRSVLGGWGGNAGEVGHMTAVVDGEPCPCGNRGCLERYVSLDALERYLRAAGRDLSVQAALAANDPVLLDWVAAVAPMLRAAVTSLENLYDPQTIVVGGAAPRALLERLIAAIEPLPHSVAERVGREVPRLVISEDGTDAVLRGAAALALSAAVSPAEHRSNELWRAAG